MSDSWTSDFRSFLFFLLPFLLTSVVRSFSLRFSSAIKRSLISYQAYNTYLQDVPCSRSRHLDCLTPNCPLFNCLLFNHYGGVGRRNIGGFTTCVHHIPWRIVILWTTTYYGAQSSHPRMHNPLVYVITEFLYLSFGQT